MILSESLVWALEGHDISGVKVMCEESICDDIAQSLMTDFSNGWKKALLKVEQVYGDCMPAYVPIGIVKKDYGFFISVGALDIRYAGGDFYDAEYGFKAFDCALENMKATYPQVEYEGYICGILSDRRAGEAFQFEVSSGSDVKIYDFVGEVLGNVFATEMYIPEEPLEADDVNFVVTGKLKFFENREEISEYIEDLGGNVTGSISKKTNYLINNDLSSTSSKNEKAKELGIPTISEAEFITLFGDPSEFELEQSDFWESLAEGMECSGDFEETIKVLYSYSNWIKKADLDRAVRAIIQIAGMCDEDLQEELVDLVKQLESGEYVDEEEDEE